MKPILQTEGLTRRFGRLTAVNNLTISVQEGDIYGFLGLNGAGKTTTIRMALGLIKPTAGAVSIFGKDVRRNFIDVMSDIGSLVELPAFYPNLSGYQNLNVLRITAGGIPEKRIDEALEIVGLADRKYDKVRTYSQGMRQRLGIAQAFLSKPRLVILDEPTNGLDPQGISDIRNTIKGMNKRDGVTFLISSHLLYEVEITCTRVGMIHRGKLIIEERVDKILEESVQGVKILAAPKERAQDITRRQPYVKEAVEQEDGMLLARLDKMNFHLLNTELVKAGIAVSEFSPYKMTLEEYFLAKSGI
ncbi:MAG: hypothetical protein A2W23_06745 [Planctomycetes bacterium RBG_16_43_13]|nr:MAG: hypothetical protein A2W23_06745 [Planctomycetes bacterium RBG_16_43_13]